MASNKEVVHRWAQDDSNIRLVHAENLTVERDRSDRQVLFSYRTPIAAFVTAQDGSRVVLITTRQHSITTSGHTNDARSAVARDRFRVFAVYDVCPNSEEAHRRNLDLILETSANFVGKAKRARAHAAQYLDRSLRLLEDADGYAKAFGLPFDRPAVPQDVVALVETRRVQEQERKTAEEAARRVAQQQEFEDWRLGHLVPVPSGYYQDASGSVYLRRLHTGDGFVVQTTLGATIPWAVAEQAFRLARLCRQRGKGLTVREAASAERVYLGQYTLSEVSDTGDLRVGCHTISWERMEEFARLFGVFDDLQPSDALLSQHAPVEAS